LSSSASPPSGRGNVFIAGDENQTTPTNLKDLNDINVNWVSNSSLVVSYPKNALVFLKKSTLAGVSIRYDAAP